MVNVSNAGMGGRMHLDYSTIPSAQLGKKSLTEYMPRMELFSSNFGTWEGRATQPTNQTTVKSFLRRTFKL